MQCVGTANTPSNFNGTFVPANSYLWFNANFTAQGVPSSGVTIDLTQGNITFTAGGVQHSLAVPNAKIPVFAGCYLHLHNLQFRHQHLDDHRADLRG